MTPSWFEPFPKLARLNRDVTITEKIDGSNMQVFIEHREVVVQNYGLMANTPLFIEHDDFFIAAGSRNKWLSHKEDLFGFNKWVHENIDELVKLGPGRHFGEWWGSGIQGSYGLKKDERRWSLFNTHRWYDDLTRPKCCHVVPILYRGPFSTEAVKAAVEALRFLGSQASPGFMKPEGVIIWHDAAQTYFKVTLEKDEVPKGMRDAVVSG